MKVSSRSGTCSRENSRDECIFELRGQRVGVAGAVAGTFGIQPLVGAFGVPYQAAEPRDERLHPGPTEDLQRNVTG